VSACSQGGYTIKYHVEAFNSRASQAMHCLPRM
jgi:hypothetical protein